MNSTNTFQETQRIGLLIRAIWAGTGMAVLTAAMVVSADTGDAYPFLKLFAASIVLTGLISWDPIYTVLRTIKLRFGQMQYYGKSAYNA